MPDLLTAPPPSEKTTIRIVGQPILAQRIPDPCHVPARRISVPGPLLRLIEGVAWRVCCAATWYIVGTLVLVAQGRVR